MAQFEGTNDIYDYWNDMNEPSVFEGEQGTMPLQNLHTRLVDGVREDVLHRDLHNIYGALQQKATYNGALKLSRDSSTEEANDQAESNSVRRPFVLTRSTFLGS